MGQDLWTPQLSNFGGTRVLKRQLVKTKVAIPPKTHTLPHSVTYTLAHTHFTLMHTHVHLLTHTYTPSLTPH